MPPLFTLWLFVMLFVVLLFVVLFVVLLFVVFLFTITVVLCFTTDFSFFSEIVQLVAGTFTELDTSVGLLTIDELEPLLISDETELSTIVFVLLLTVTGTDTSVDLFT